MKHREIIIGLVGLLLGAAVVYIVLPTGEPAAQEVSGEEEGQIWTCSMHPQVERSEPGQCPICEMDLIPKGSGGSDDDPYTLTMTQEAVRISAIQTEEVRSEGGVEATEVLSVSGFLRPNQNYTSSLVAYFSGEIRRLAVRSEGERVRKGQKIAEIYAPELRLHQEDLLRAHRQRDQRPELFRAALRKLENWQIDSGTIQRILEEQEVFETLPLYAKAGGTITELMVEEGDYINRGQRLMSVSDLSRLWVEFEINEADLNKVELGSSVVFSTLSDRGRKHQARIDYQDPSVDPDSRTAIVRGSLRSSGKALRPGMLVRGHVMGSSGSGSLSIPSSAVLWTGERSVVYVEDTAATVPTYRFVEVGIDEFGGERTLVKSGLSPGMQVVTNGAFTIDAAAQLNNQRSMMNDQVEVKGSGTGQGRSVNPFVLERAVELLDLYIHLKDALVKSEPAAAAARAEELLPLLEAIPPLIEQARTRQLWNQQQSEALHALQQIGGSEDLNLQREHFETISEAVKFWITHFQIADQKYYIQHCPMAFDNRGADWISLDDFIRNPYFGDQMLKCGSVEDTIHSH